MIKVLYISSTILFLFILTGCSSKLDTKETNMIPEQAMGITSKEYSATEQIIKNNPNWDKELENETLRFNMYVQDTFNEIDNKKEYLKKIYNVQYYNFDDKGFNKNINNSPLKQLKSQDEDIKSKKFGNTNEVIENKKSDVNSSSTNSVPKTMKKENKSYDSHLFNEYNF